RRSSDLHANSWASGQQILVAADHSPDRPNRLALFLDHFASGRSVVAGSQLFSWFLRPCICLVCVVARSCPAGRLRSRTFNLGTWHYCPCSFCARYRRVGRRAFSIAVFFPAAVCGFVSVLTGFGVLPAYILP